MFPVLRLSNQLAKLSGIVRGLLTAQRTHCAQTSYFVHCNLPSSLSTTLFLLLRESRTFTAQTFIFVVSLTGETRDRQTGNQCDCIAHLMRTQSARLFLNTFGRRSW